MKGVKKYIQNEYIRNAFILSNRKDIRIAVIPKLYEMLGRLTLIVKHMYIKIIKLTN